MTEKSVQDHFELEELAFQHRRWAIALLLVLGAFMVWKAFTGLNDQPTVKNAAASQFGIIPSQLHIPALGITASVQQITELKAAGLNGKQFGWLKTGVMPGESGVATLLYDQAGGKSLSALKPGDKLYITDANGRQFTFEVTGVAAYSGNPEQLNNLPDVSGEKQLRLLAPGESQPDQPNPAAKWLVVSTRLVSDQG
jgi:hypothetical protein